MTMYPFFEQDSGVLWRAIQPACKEQGIPARPNHALILVGQLEDIATSEIIEGFVCTCGAYIEGTINAAKHYVKGE